MAIADTTKTDQTDDGDELEIDWSKPSQTVPTMCKALGISNSSGYAAVARGELPAIRVRGRLIVPTSALKRLLQVEESS